MANKLYTEFLGDVEEYLKRESETIRMVSDHLKMIDESNRLRTFSAMFGQNVDEMENIDQIKKDLFEELVFSFSHLNDDVIETLSKTDDMMVVEDEILQICDEVTSPKTLNQITSLIALKKNGEKLIEKHQGKFGDISSIPYRASFHCPHCGNDTKVALTIRAMTTSFMAKSECNHCGHSPKLDCQCDFCIKGKMVFDLAKVVEKNLLDAKFRANRSLSTYVSDYKVVENHVKMPELLAKYMSFKGGASKQAKEVIDKAVEVFRLTNNFEFETFDFTKNIVGEEDAKKVASELYKIGFFYKAGYIPRQNMGVHPIIGLGGSGLKTLYLTPAGSVCVSDVEPDEYQESSLFIESMDDIRAVYEVKPHFVSVFAINIWALEHEAFGGVYSMDDKREVRQSGKILQNQSVRDAFERELDNGAFYVFPDVKLSKLIDISILNRVLNNASIKLLENFEANLVCFDTQYEPKRIYLTSGRKGLDVIEATISPILESKGIEIVML